MANEVIEIGNATNIMVMLMILLILLVVAVVFMAYDSLDRRRTLVDVRNRAEKNTHLLNSIPAGIGIFVAKPEGLFCTYANAYFKDMLGHGVAIEEFGKKPLSLLLEEDVSKIKEILENLKEGDAPAECTVRFKILEDSSGVRLKWFKISVRVISASEDAKTFYATFDDVDANVMATKKLEEAEETITAVIEMSDVLYWEYYPEKHATKEGVKAQRLTGVSSEVSDYPESWIRNGFVHPDYADAFRELHRKIDEGADFAEADILEKHGMGPYCWDHIIYQTVRDEDGNRLKVIGTCQDISTQKALEVHFERYMDAIVEMNPDAICSFRMNLTTNWCGDGRFLDDRFCFLAETETVDDFFKKSITLAPTSEHADYRRRFSRKKLLQAYAEGETSISYEHRIYLEADNTIWVRTFVNMANNPSNGDVEAIIFAININESKLTRSIIDNTVVSDYDELIYLDINDGRYTVFGRGSIETHRDYYKDSEKMIDSIKWVDQDEMEELRSFIVKKNIKAQILTGKKHECYYSVWDNNSVKRKKMSFVMLSGSDDKAIITVSDITSIYVLEQKKNAELTRALQTAEEASSAKSDFLARMSHDIRTPMNGVIGMTRLALEENDTAKIKDYLGKIDSSAHFLLGLINDVLDMSKIESGNIVLSPAEYPSEEFAGYIDAVFANQCKAKNIELKIDYEDNYPTCLFVDKLRFNQIYFNLLSNAVKYTPEGGEVCLWFGEYDYSIPGYVGIHSRISDNGIGIAPEFMEHLFEPFSQEHANKVSSSGTGLGLAIVKKLVGLIGGTIEVESEKGKGTTFSVNLMLPYIEEEELAEKEEERVSSGNILKDKHILLCEDNSINAEIATMTLEQKGIRVDWAENGAIGVQKFVDSHETGDLYDAILMDIRMPELDGLGAAREIRASGKEDSADIPIIAMTANAFSEDISMSREAGMNAHLSKPFNPEELYRTLEKYIEERND